MLHSFDLRHRKFTLDKFWSGDDHIASAMFVETDRTLAWRICGSLQKANMHMQTHTKTHMHTHKNMQATQGSQYAMRSESRLNETKEKMDM